MIIDHRANIPKKDLPDVVLTGGEEPKPAAVQLLTAPNLAHVIGMLGLRVRFNVMTHDRVFTGRLRLAERDKRKRQKSIELTADERMQWEAYQVVSDALMLTGIKQLSSLDDVLTLVARRDEYHPMADWIDSAPWDGKDRLAELADTVKTESTMWPTYLRKWLIQGVEAVCGWENPGTEPRQLGNVLCFVGDQGAGKTRWFASLAPGFVMSEAELHLNSVGSKDHQLQVLSWPLVELSEISGSKRKSDSDALKSFLTRTTDVIRRPYARRALERPRMTIFAGTVNDVEFLQDHTGARRYWPLEAEGKINWEHGIDMQQVWAQAQAAWAGGEAYWLEKEEVEKHSIETGYFEDRGTAIESAAAHFIEHGGNHENYAVLNLTEIRNIVETRGGHVAERARLKAWLVKKLGKPRNLQVPNGKLKKRAWLWPLGEFVGYTTVPATEVKKYLRWQGSKTPE